MTLYRKRKIEEELAAHAAGYRRIDTMFLPKALPVARTQDEPDNPLLSEQEKMEEAEENLRLSLSRIRNKDSPFAGLSGFQLQRLFAVQRYFEKRLEGVGKMAASTDAAQSRWISPTAHTARCIRQWADVYLQLGELPEYKQGKHAKRESFLDDEDVKQKGLTWLRTTAVKDRSPAGLKQYIEETVMPAKLGVAGRTISVDTVIKFLRLWGFEKKEIGQQVSDLQVDFTF